MQGLVRKRQLVKKHVQMACAGVNIHGLDRVSRGEVDTIERLCQFQKVRALLTGARHFSCFKIPVVRRRGNHAEIDMVVPKRDFAVRIARRDRERVRCFCDHLHDEVLVHEDSLPFNANACLFEDRKSLGVEKLDPDL